jgi:hypothetical protein
VLKKGHRGTSGEPIILRKESSVRLCTGCFSEVEAPTRIFVANSEVYFATNLDLGAGWRVYFETLEIDEIHCNKVHFFIWCC